jgi:hypothetical protein
VQVLVYKGDRPVETVKIGILRVGSHSKYGFGELRVSYPTTEVVGLSVDSPSADIGSEAVYSPFRFSVPDFSAH